MTHVLYKETIDDEGYREILSLGLPSLRKIYIHYMDQHSTTSIAQHRLFEGIASLQVIQLQFGNNPESRCCVREDPFQWTSVPPQSDEWKNDASLLSGLEESMGRLTLGHTG